MLLVSIYLADEAVELPGVAGAVQDLIAQLTNDRGFLNLDLVCKRRRVLVYVDLDKVAEAGEDGLFG